jgi:hypothetical protein
MVKGVHAVNHALNPLMLYSLMTWVSNILHKVLVELLQENIQPHLPPINNPKL